MIPKDPPPSLLICFLMTRTPVLLFLVLGIITFAWGLRKPHVASPTQPQSERPLHSRITDFRTGASKKRSFIQAASEGLQWTVALRCTLDDTAISRVHSTLAELNELYYDLSTGQLDTVPEAVPCTLALAQQSSRRTFFVLHCTEKSADMGERLAAALNNSVHAILPESCYVSSDRILIAPDSIARNASTTQSVPTIWHLDRLDQRLGGNTLNQQYTYERTGTGVTVYVIDTGVHESHTDFGGRATMAYNFAGDGIGDDCNGALFLLFHSLIITPPVQQYGYLYYCHADRGSNLPVIFL
jgi:hypothetical protein